MKFTRTGDVNLDGTVGFADLLALAQHYGAAHAVWDQGDVDYDGAVSFVDLLALAQNYGGTAGAFPGATMVAAAPATIPEPAVVFWVVVASCLARRRRRF
jgi:hypothetical protein